MGTVHGLGCHQMDQNSTATGILDSQASLFLPISCDLNPKYTFCTIFFVKFCSCLFQLFNREGYCLTSLTASIGKREILSNEDQNCQHVLVNWRNFGLNYLLEKTALWKPPTHKEQHPTSHDVYAYVSCYNSLKCTSLNCKLK
jgi:hypothetical protein